MSLIGIVWIVILITLLFLLIAHSRSVGQHGNVPVPREASVGGSIYNQPVPYGFQQGFTYPPFGYVCFCGFFFSHIYRYKIAKLHRYTSEY